jgi:hypothetical protein
MPPPAPALPPSREIHIAFDKDVPMSEAAGTLELAILATESLHGTERVQLDAAWSLDRPTRNVTIDTGTEAGRTLAMVFFGLSRREFGAASVRFRHAAPARRENAGAAT